MFLGCDFEIVQTLLESHWKFADVVKRTLRTWTRNWLEAARNSGEGNLGGGGQLGAQANTSYRDSNVTVLIN